MMSHNNDRVDRVTEVVLDTFIIQSFHQFNYVFILLFVNRLQSVILMSAGRQLGFPKTDSWYLSQKIYSSSVVTVIFINTCIPAKF